MTETNYKNSLFLELLNRHIKDKKISRTKVSKILGIHQTTVNNWFLGKYPPSAYYYIQLCEMFDIDTKSILLNSQNN